MIYMRFIKPKDVTPDSLILDLREFEEHDEESLVFNHELEPLRTLQPEIFIKEHNLDGNQTINIICSSGGRSSQSAPTFVFEKSKLCHYQTECLALFSRLPIDKLQYFCFVPSFLRFLYQILYKA